MTDRNKLKRLIEEYDYTMIISREKLRSESAITTDIEQECKRLGITPEEGYEWYDIKEGRYKISKVLFSDCQDLYSCKSIVDKDYGIIIPTIFISYSRSYFSFRGLRFTFDNNIEYINLRAQIPWKCRDPECVMEIKTEFNIEDDYISDVIKMATSRFSKYCRGIEMLNELANYN